FRSDLEENRPEEAIARTATTLHSALIAPAQRWLKPDDTLIFIPDKGLHLVPFAALRDPRSNRYLIEDYAIGVAPSATFFLESNERARSLGTAPLQDALVAGAPQMDLRRFRQLSSLAGAAREIEQVATVYGNGAEVLTKEKATPGAVLARAGEHTVVHLVSHGFANMSTPALSGLVLTPENREDSGVLYARDVE